MADAFSNRAKGTWRPSKEARQFYGKMHAANRTAAANKADETLRAMELCPHCRGKLPEPLDERRAHVDACRKAAIEAAVQRKKAAAP